MISNLIGRRVIINSDGRLGEIALITQGQTGVVFYILMSNGCLDAYAASSFRVKD